MNGSPFFLYLDHVLPSFKVCSLLSFLKLIRSQNFVSKGNNLDVLGIRGGLNDMMRQNLVTCWNYSSSSCLLKTKLNQIKFGPLDLVGYEV